MAKHQLHSNCLFCGQEGHKLASCEKRLSILGSTGKANPNVQFLLRETNSATPVFRREYHPFGIQPNQTTRHFRCTPLLAPGVKSQGNSSTGINPLYASRRTQQYDTLLQDFESTNHTFRKISTSLKHIQGICLYPVMDLMWCGAVNIEDHVCGGQPQPIYHRVLQSPCVNPATGVKCLAGAKVYSFGTAKTYHTCAQFAPTDPNHPWNYGKQVCGTCNIPHLSDVRCEVALDFAAPTYEQWKLQNLCRIQALPFYASPRQRNHAKSFSGLQSKTNLRPNSGFFRHFTNHFGKHFFTSLPISPPQRPLPPTPQQQRVHESLPRFQATPQTEEILYDEIEEEDSNVNKLLMDETPNRIQQRNMIFTNYNRETSPSPEPKYQGQDLMESHRILDFRSKDFQKYLWTPKANYIHQSLQDLRPFVSVRVPLLYWFAPSPEKWFKYQTEDTASKRNLLCGTAFWYMPAEWIHQFPKDKAPNAIFGMCPKSVCSGTPCEVYRYKGYLYCDHGYTDNEDAHKGLVFQFVAHLSKDPQKAVKRIVNYFPITATKPCYRIQDSAKLYCPEVVQHTADTPVYSFDGNLYCIHGYTNAWAKEPEKYPVSLRPVLSDHWLHRNEQLLGSHQDQQPKAKHKRSDSLSDCQNKLAQMHLAPNRLEVSFDTPNTVRTHSTVTENLTPVPNSSTNSQNDHKSTKECKEPELSNKSTDPCIHGYLPIDGHKCKSTQKLSACVGRCLRNKCDFHKDFHSGICPKIQPKGPRTGQEIGRKGGKQLIVGYEPDSGVFHGIKLPKRIQRPLSQRAMQKQKSNKIHSRRLDRFGKDPFISATVHTDPELCPISILKRHNSRYPYNTTADSFNDLH